MSRSISTRFANRLVVFFFAIKVVVLGWNAATFSAGRQYDFYHHVWRARSAGLEVGRMAYNPPLYYLPVLPKVDLHRFYKNWRPILNLPIDNRAGIKEVKHLIDALRVINVVYVVAFYALFIWGVFPWVLARPGETVGKKTRGWLLASTFLLALPGIEKAAVMAHPDVLFMALTALSSFVWLRLERRPVMTFGKSLLLAFVTGLTGATRPFAVVSVAAHWFANVYRTVRDQLAGAPDRPRRPLIARLGAAAGKVALITAIVAGLSGGWWAYRYAYTGEVLDAYPTRYIGVYQPLKKGYDYRHYYTSFYPIALLKEPSRAMALSDLPNLDPKGNTFFTILYSEIWGDHWGYFSGASKLEKDWPKRILFVFAFPISLYFVYRVWKGLVTTVRDAIVTRKLVSPATLFAGTAFLGAALFVYWQGHAGLLPGKNSTIKYLYVAWMTPYAIAVAFRGRFGSRTFHAALALIVVTFMAALPVCIHWPDIGVLEGMIAPAPPLDPEVN